MSASGPEETERLHTPLTRADIELLCRGVEGPAGLDLSLQNLQNCNLAYMDLHGANVRGANLQGANLRGTNLSDANLQEADLSEADLDGADLSRASLGGNSVSKVNLYRANLSHATLRNLDLRGFDLSELTMQNADLNGSDLRDAILRGTDLRGADLSTTLLHGPELRGARLYGGDYFGIRLKSRPQDSTREKIHAPGAAMLTHERAPISQTEMEQIKGGLSDREAYLLGKQTLLTGADPVKVRGLFPQGFTFDSARQLFDGWLTQIGEGYSEKERQAMWIGFAHRICELYYEDPS